MQRSKYDTPDPRKNERNGKKVRKDGSEEELLDIARPAALLPPSLAVVQCCKTQARRNAVLHRLLLMQGTQNGQVSGNGGDAQGE